ncbi:MAG: cytochrome P450, partial [Bdellovibrionales bacterium]|nr:cytochrome P450 [Bdellovibrionales bacterium]
LFRSFVWEALRFRPVNTVVVRLAESDYVLAKDTSREYKVKKGQMVVAAVMSAMFDESYVQKPNNFRIDREGMRSPNTPYLHLGYGHHKCLGDMIAEIMVPEVLKEIVILDGLKMVEGAIGKISYDDNIKTLEEDKDWAQSPFPESFVVQYNGPREKGHLSVADPRFAFEDYLMDYDRVFYRKCLGNYTSLKTMKNVFSPMMKNLKEQFSEREIEDIFLCRLPDTFHQCISTVKSDGYKEKYNKCKGNLSPNEDFFFKTEMFGEPLDLTKLPEPEKAGINTGFEFEEDLKFYDRGTFRMAHRNPMAATAFPVKDDMSTEEALFYTRLEWKFRICIAKNALILRRPDEAAYRRCMTDEKLKLDSLTDAYYQQIFFKKKWSPSDESTDNGDKF